MSAVAPAPAKTDADSSAENSAGIPPCKFIEDVVDFLKRSGDQPVQEAIRDAEELYTKYKYMEQHFTQRRQRLLRQIPDISNNIGVIDFLRQKDNEQAFTTSFLLSDNVYANAKIESTEKVGVWLGANVMLEYDLGEAESLLSKNLSTAEANLEELDKNLDFVKDQITTSEVNIARLYNHGVMLQKQQNAQAGNTSK